MKKITSLAVKYNDGTEEPLSVETLNLPEEPCYIILKVQAQETTADNIDKILASFIKTAEPDPKHKILVLDDRSIDLFIHISKDPDRVERILKTFVELDPDSAERMTGEVINENKLIN